MSRKEESGNIASRAMHVVALYDYTPGQSHIDLGNTCSRLAPHLDTQLSFVKGDTFKVTGDADWWLYVASNDGKTGYVPSILTAPLKIDGLSIEQ